MNVSLGDRWEKFVETTVQEGRFASASVDNTMVIINIFEGHRDTDSHVGEHEE